MPEDTSDLLERLRPRPLIAILRAADAGHFVPAATRLYEAGITCLELTLTTAGALDALLAVRKALPDDAILGVGTVLTQQQAADSVAAGAQFLVSPVFQPWMAEPHDGGRVPFLPGALTPTEILTAWRAGVPAVKVSPVGPVGGPAYLSQVRGPLPDIPLMPTGGIDLDAVPAYLAGGAVAVGLGGPLLGDALREGGDLGALGERAARLVAAVTPA